MEYPVKRAASYFRPLHFEGTPIDRICLHNGERVLLTIQQGWLEHHSTTENVTGPSSGSDIIGINITPRMARTVNLSKKDNFIVSYADKEKSYFEKGKALYIYVPKLKIEREITNETNDGTQVYSCTFYTFPLECEVLCPKLDENEKLVYVATPIKNVTLQANHRWINTPRGDHIAGLSKALKDRAGVDISEYQIQKILKHFHLSLKEGNQ